MGQRGPVPKRSSERRRRNKESKVETVAPIAEKVDQPTADPKWHPVAADWYESLAVSGQARFYEPSDWRYAYFVADLASGLLKQPMTRRSSQMTAAVMSGMNDLLTTEAARRRVRLEVERETEMKPASVTSLEDFRKSLGA